MFACELALRAASAFGIDLTGVDLLPDGRGGWVVLELNGAVDPAPEYSLGAEDVFARIVRTLVDVSGQESAALECASVGRHCIECVAAGRAVFKDGIGRDSNPRPPV